MADTDTHCQELLDEYQALRRRLEEDELSNPEIDETRSDEQQQSDRDRLEEVKEELEDECDIELPEEGEEDIDLPDHATGSPSEPMDFDAE